MCGIAGFLRLDSEIPRSEGLARLSRMTQAIAHRGPDGEGAWTDGRCGLGHRRLAVIDLTPAGAQPMQTADARFTIVFNGEIYNFQEIRRELEEAGAAFASNSDTEVILEGYRRWGDAVIDRLRGMFAIALWDAPRQRLLLVRDRLGKKPLYFARSGDAFIFGSELKALVAWPGFDRTPDLAAIHQYFTYQYISAPLSGFASASKLPPAHKLVVERRGDSWRVGEPQRYWSLPPPTSRPASNFDPRAEEERLVGLLRESIRLRMISDVPLGAFLSGGVDSSAVVALMADQSPRPIRTFSIGSPYPEYDETKYAREVAARYGTDHEEVVLEAKAADILEKLVWHFSEPFADASMIPTYYVSEIARRRVTVALNGDGGDEAFLGYPRYDTVRRLSADIDPAPGRQGIARDSERYAFTVVSMSDDQKRSGYGEKMRGFLDRSSLDLLDPYFDQSPDFVSGANWADTHVYLPGDLLPKVDIASMAVSLEPRSPLLDHVLLEWAYSLPADIKAPGGVAKGLFKKAMEPYLSRDLLYRPKMGFGCPIDHWLRTDLKEMACDVLLSDRAASRGYLKREFVARMLDEHINNVNAHHTRLFALLNLELWHRIWVDQPVEQALISPPAPRLLTGAC